MHKCRFLKATKETPRLIGDGLEDRFAPQSSYRSQVGPTRR